MQTVAAKMMIVRAIQGNLELELISPSTGPLKEITKDAFYCHDSNASFKLFKNVQINSILISTSWGAQLIKIEKDLQTKPRGISIAME